MKRILVGVTVLGCVVGLGSAGAYYGHHLLTPAAPKAETQPAPAPIARDLTPTPIRLAEAMPVEPTGPANPFAGGPAAASAAVAVEEPRAAEPAPADDNAVEEALPDSALKGDIPSADNVEGAQSETAESRSIPPTTSARYDDRNDRYAEQPAAAEGPETGDEPADSSAEPRALAPVATRQPLDRYGRAKTEGEPAENQPQKKDAPGPAEPAPLEPLNPAPASGPQPSADEGTGRPGDPKLSGAQAPTITIEKSAPPEIQIGKPAKFMIKVRNAGSVVAHGVEIHDTIPQGTQLVNTVPPATRGDNGELIFDLGSLKPNDERTAELELMPMTEGEIGSVASVHFRAEASVRTVATKPMLTLDVSAPQQVMKGQELTLSIKIANPGSGAAAGVVITENVPDGLSHSGGQELEFDIGTLRPGESRELQLGLVAAEAGPVVNTLTAHGEGNLRIEVQTALEVIAPKLEVSLAGPKRRYLERNATHNISVSNPGTAAAKDIELVAVLPRELKFVEANNNGQFDAATHSVYWSLDELPPQETGTVTLTTLPVQAGDARLLIKSTAKENLTDQREEVVAIEGLAAINFQLSDASDPIEAGGQTTYEVRVTNQGTKAAAGVRLVALLPPEMKGISAEGPARYRIEGQRVVFEPLKQLAPKADTVFKITVQALQPGDLRLQVQISTDEIREPITKEESTRVYGDE